jgi:glycosyltransferase involved in cell wall biosynthesis
MKILYLTNIPAPYRVDFFNLLGKYCDLYVAYERANASNRNVKWTTKEKSNHNEILLKSLKIGNESSITFQTIPIIKKLKFDAIVVSGYSSPTALITMLYLITKKIPYILSVDGGFIRKESKIKYLFKKFFISRASLYLSTGKKTSEFLEYYGAIEEKIKIYPFSSIRGDEIQNSSYERSLYKRKIGITEKKMILSVGQFIYRKGYDVLIKSCKNLDKDVGIYIVGGSPTEEYMILKKELQLDNLHFVGFKSKDELNDYYKAADIFVLPTREDIWGLVINEALSYGLPTITTYNCIAGTELIINDENGYLINVNDENDLEEKIRKILENNDLSKKMRKNCLESIKSFTIENMAKVCYEEINSFIQNERC